jgi:hypothetical protein
MSDVTRILSEIETGDTEAAEQLLPLVYEELRKLAAAKLAQQKPGQTLQPTALASRKPRLRKASPLGSNGRSLSCGRIDTGPPVRSSRHCTAAPANSPRARPSRTISQPWS